MRIRVIAAAACAFAVVASIGCGSVTDPSKNTTETFTGTVAPGGRGTIHPFNVSNGGEYAVKVTAMTPTFNSFFGTFLGTGDGCSITVQVNTLSIVGSQSLSGPIFQKGAYCVFVYDANGTMTTTETYTMTVSHP
jgi:hypothetical protein